MIFSIGKTIVLRNYTRIPCQLNELIFDPKNRMYFTGNYSTVYVDCTCNMKTAY
jgi:hypothetical protein